MKAITNNRLNFVTLMAHLGTNSIKVFGDPDSTDSKEVEADISDLDTKLATYVYVEPPALVVERSITEEASTALISLRSIANGTTSMTVAQLTAAIRSLARVLIVLVRLQLRRFDGTN